MYSCGSKNPALALRGITGSLRLNTGSLRVNTGSAKSGFLAKTRFLSGELWVLTIFYGFPMGKTRFSPQNPLISIGFRENPRSNSLRARSGPLRSALPPFRFGRGLDREMLFPLRRQLKTGSTPKIRVHFIQRGALEQRCYFRSSFIQLKRLQGRWQGWWQSRAATRRSPQIVVDIGNSAGKSLWVIP